MTDDIVVAGSRNPWLRLCPRAMTILCVVLALAIAGCGSSSPSDQTHREIVAQLDGLLAENGLFMRPGMSPDGEPSWAASAYGLSALVATGQSVPATTLAPTTLVPQLNEQIEREPIWGRWYAVQIEAATGVRFPGAWAMGLLDDVQLPQDPAGQIAGIAALVDVVGAKTIPVPGNRTTDLIGKLNAALVGLRSPYSWCRALDSAAGLQHGTGGWAVPVLANVELGQPFSAASLMDVYGTLCVHRHQQRPVGEQQLVRVRDWLKPQLDFDVAGFELEAYLVARTWLDAGGERARLQALAAKLRDRIDRPTGLMRQHVTRLGTLENTYYVALIADTIDAAPRLLRARTLAAVRDILPLARDKAAISDLLMSAVIFRLADKPDAVLEQEAGNWARRWLAGGVSRSNVVQVALVTTLLQQLGQRFDHPTAVAFPVRDHQDRYLAWTMLSISHHLGNGEDIRREFGNASREVMPALAAPDELSVREIAVAMRVPDSGLDRNRLPAPLIAWAAAVRGCSGFSALFRPIRSERRCSLEATALMIAAGLSQSDPPAKEGGR